MFGGLKGAARVGRSWAANDGWKDVPSPELDLRAYSSRLASLATLFFRMSNSFWC